MKFTIFCNRCQSAVTSFTYRKAEIDKAIETHCLYCGCNRIHISLHKARS